MDTFEPSAFWPLGGIVTLAVLFVLRELTSGVLKEAGKELWGWARARRSLRNASVDEVAEIESRAGNVVGSDRRYRAWRSGLAGH
jgi:hypothetical protein